MTIPAEDVIMTNGIIKNYPEKDISFGSYDVRDDLK